MLLYFRVENYKCLELAEFPLTPIHVLIGRNDSGKTSVLEALLAYITSISRPLDVHDAIPAGWEGRELVYHGTPKGGQVSLTGMGNRSLAPRDAFSGIGRPPNLIGYGFALNTPPSGRWSIAREWTVARRPREKPGEQPEEIVQSISSANVTYTTPGFRIAQGTDLEGVETQLKLPRGTLGPASLYRFDPKVLAVPATLDVHRKFRMDPDGFGLSTLLDDIIGYDPDLFLQLRKRFLDFFPMFRTIRVETAAGYMREYGPLGVHAFRQVGGNCKEIIFETQWGGIVHAREASEGALLFLAFLALVHLPAPQRPKILLLEEPERGVYPKKLEELIQALKSWVKENGESAPQIVMATHSPYLLSFFQPEEVTFLTRGPTGGVRARPLRDAPSIHERLSGGFYLGELWYNLSEEELFSDGRQ